MVKGGLIRSVLPNNSITHAWPGLLVMPLSQSEIEAPKSARDILPWVLSKIDEISVSDKGELVVQQPRGLAKILTEESLPLGYFAHHYFEASSNVMITQVVGSQSFDAQVFDKRENPSSLKYVEITQAHEGENEFLRMWVMKKKGHVNLLGAVRKKGTKKRGLKVDVKNEAKRHSEVISDQLRRIETAVERKRCKHYPAQTALVIAFDDHIAFQDPDELATLKTWSRRCLLPRLSGFELISLIGTSGRSHLSFKVGSDAI